MFAAGKTFQKSIVFARKAGAYPIETPFRALIQGRLLALPTNNKLGWKCLPGTNALAYYEYLTAVISFMIQAKGANVVKLFTSVSYDFS